MISTTRTAISALACGVALLAAGAEPAVDQDRSVSTPTLELPPQVPVELSSDANRELGLYQLGACCYTRSLLREPPALLETVPEPQGRDRLFHVIELGRSKIVLSFEDLEDDSSADDQVLVRADLDQDGDLSNDPALVCRRDALCGPIRAEVRHDGGAAPYTLALRYFAASERQVLWYWRSAALLGTIGGRRIAVIDDDSNGTYDDPEDLVVVDLDGDGKLDGGLEGRERMPRHAAIPWGDAFLSVGRVDPVAGSLSLEQTPEVESHHSVIDAQTGIRIAGARITFHPGGFWAVSDSRGRVLLRHLEARPDFVTAVADGYWGKVYGPGQDAGEVPDTIELEPGPCRSDRMHWCGRETLETASLIDCRLDLDSGVVGPRAGDPPGPWDLGWFAPGEGMLLAAEGETRLAVLDGADFDSLRVEDLHRLAYEETRLVASEACNEGPIRGAVDPDGRLRRGLVLGIRTAEGRLGKIRVGACGWNLELSWVLYDDAGAGTTSPGAEGARER